MPRICRTRTLRRACRLAVTTAAAACALGLAAPAHAAGPGIYGPPAWLPVRSSSDGVPFVVGCVRTNCTVSGAPYHDYWALDLADHAQEPGAPVFAAGEGQVYAVDASHTACGPSGTPANYVVVDHGGGLFSRYVHLSTILVSVGQWVDQETELGTVGAVGYTFPCPWYHLHFDVYQASGGAIAFQDPGPLQACHGSTLVSYPSALGYDSWDAIPPYGSGVWSDGTACGARAPGPPTDVVATARNGEATVSFTPPTADGGASITSYAVVAQPGGRTETATTDTVTVGGLASGTSYTFTVAALNAAGAGPPSPPSNPVTPVPAAAVRATASGKVRVAGRPFTSGRVPYGAIVDVSRGTLRLRTDAGTLAVRAAGGPGSFRLRRVSQAANGVLVELLLTHGDFSFCREPSTAGHVVRGLKVTSHGRFRVAARYAAVTARTATWVIEDRCDGTLTRVKTGSVRVLTSAGPARAEHAGRAYLARGG